MYPLRKFSALIALVTVATAFVPSRFAHAELTMDAGYLKFTDANVLERGRYRVDLIVESSVGIEELIVQLQWLIQSDEESGYRIKNEDVELLRSAIALRGTPQRLILASNHFKGADFKKANRIKFSTKKARETLQAEKLIELSNRLNFEAPTWKLNFRVSRYLGFLKGYEVIETSTPVVVSSLNFELIPVIPSTCLELLTE